MSAADDDGVNLTAQEARVLALYLAARHLAMGEWLEWESVPQLGEHAFMRLADAADALAVELSGQWKRLAEHYDIDPAYLHERATS